jgi:hypothetical protein
VMAFLLACAINSLWFVSVQRTAENEVPGAAAYYALGAGIGTASAMALSRLF